MDTTLEGVVEHITYHSTDTHYTVGRLKTQTVDSVVTFVGKMPDPRRGQALRITGRWVAHPRYGTQFQVKTLSIIVPESVEGILGFLESGAVKGIGPKTAARLVAHFGEKTLTVMETDPQKLCEVDGIGRKRALEIAETWRHHRGVERLVDFLREHGADTAAAGVIYDKFGVDAVDFLCSDPYRIALEVPEVGFPVADAIGQNLGVPEDDPDRVGAALLHFLEKYVKDGHTFMFDFHLKSRLAQGFDFDETGFEAALARLLERRLIGVDTLGTDAMLALDERMAETAGEVDRVRAVYPKMLHFAETRLAARLKGLAASPYRRPEMNAKDLLDAVVSHLAVMPSSEQNRALSGILDHPVSIVTGGPGTGKTTLIRAVTAVFRRLGKRVLLSAPTGRAARRLAEVTGREAATIHRMLEMNPVEGHLGRHRDLPLDAEAVIVDEASMIDVVLMHHLIDAVPFGAVLVLVGDAFQLPSVGPGNVLADLIASETAPVFQLNEIFRQARESRIVVNAHRIREGEEPDLPPVRLEDLHPARTECVFLEETHPEKLAETIVWLNTQVLPQRFGIHPIADIQVLTPTHKGAVGTLQLNPVLQAALNPADPSAETAVTAAAGAFHPGDKVMHLKNNYVKDVFNGDIGVVMETVPAKKRLTVDYGGRAVEYAPEDLRELTLAYAVTIHKSQGSEYPAVIVPLLPQHRFLLYRNLLYTAVTRAKRLVLIAGAPKALENALVNDKPMQRLSGLALRLRGEL